jgi:hypothetical protein
MELRNCSYDEHVYLYICPACNLVRPYTLLDELLCKKPSGKVGRMGLEALTAQTQQ